MQPSEQSTQNIASEKFSGTPSKWQPSYGKDDVFSFDESFFIIKKIEAPERKKSFFIDLAELQHKWFYRFYSRHLKQYSLIRWFFLWLWKNIRFIYLNFKLLTKLFNSSKWYAFRWRPLIKLSDYENKKRIKSYMLADEAVVETPVPKAFPLCDREYMVSPHSRYKFPKISAATLNNGMVYGGSNLVLSNHEVVCHDLYNFIRDYTSEELHGRAIIKANKNCIRWLLHDESPKRIPMAASFVDACAPNYAHWLTEVLPRVAIFCTDERFKNIPIVVNDGLHKNIMEALLLLTGVDREVYLLPVGRAVIFDKLYVTSVAGYVPFDWRSKKFSDCSHGKFSPSALRVMCKHLTKLAEKVNYSDWPKKIFLRRNANYRIVLNSDEVEKFFLSNGYVVVEPEKLTFLQQVALFQNAEAIASASGAALANLIFAPPDSKISIFIGKHPDTIYWYWQNIACATGKTVQYVLGDIKDSKLNGVHSSFTLNLDELEALISSMKER